MKSNILSMLVYLCRYIELMIKIINFEFYFEDSVTRLLITDDLI